MARQTNCSSLSLPSSSLIAAASAERDVAVVAVADLPREDEPHEAPRRVGGADHARAALEGYEVIVAARIVTDVERLDAVVGEGRGLARIASELDRLEVVRHVGGREGREELPAIAREHGELRVDLLVVRDDRVERQVAALPPSRRARATNCGHSTAVGMRAPWVCGRVYFARTRPTGTESP
jgi:hypothetical protein